MVKGGWVPQNMEDYYWRMYLKTLDLNNTDCFFVQNLGGLLLKAANAEDYSTHLKAVPDFHEDDLITAFQLKSYNPKLAFNHKNSEYHIN